MYVLPCLLLLGSVNAYVDFVPDVADFTGIALTGPFVVRVNIKENSSVRVTADLDDVNISDFLSITVENDTLSIAPVASSSEKSLDDFASLVHIYVNAVSISNLILNGSGALIVDSLVSSPSVNILNNGSGNISLRVDSKSLNVVVNGPGTVDTRGKSDTASLLLSGPGKVMMSKLECGSVSVGMLAAGDVTLDVHDTVSVIQTAPGSVKYTGEAKLNVMKLGFGSIVGLGASPVPVTVAPSSLLGLGAPGSSLPGLGALVPVHHVFWSSIRKSGRLIDKDQEMGADIKAVGAGVPVLKDPKDQEANAGSKASTGAGVFTPKDPPKSQ